MLLLVSLGAQSWSNVLIAANQQSPAAHVRSAVGNDVLIAAGGYVSSPREALVLRDAGADVIVVAEGLATAGPGLAKRINDALTAAKVPAPQAPLHTWFAAFLFQPDCFSLPA